MQNKKIIIEFPKEIDKHTRDELKLMFKLLCDNIGTNGVSCKIKKGKKQIVKINCQICDLTYLYEFPESLTKKEMDKIEFNFVCNKCIQKYKEK